MPEKNDKFLEKLLATFRVEADEHLEAMSSGLVNLERAATDAQKMEIVEVLFREAHSLKGAARAVNLREIEAVCHSIESLFGTLKAGRMEVTAARIDVVHQALETLGGMLGGAKSAQQGAGAVIGKLEASSRGADPGARETPAARPDRPSPEAGEAAPLPIAAPASATIRIRTDKLDSVLRQTEELLAPRLALGRRVVELREIREVLATLKRARGRAEDTPRAIETWLSKVGAGNGGAGGRPEIKRLIEVLKKQDEILTTVEARVAGLEKSAEADHRTLDLMVDNLLRDVKEMHMLPAVSLLDAFPRLVRELARDQDKQVELVIEGSEIEVDRRILEEMKDPLIHLVRNSIDHGLETTPVRTQKGKPPRASLTIAVSHRSGSKVEFLVADDGAGIDLEKTKETAQRLGLVAPGDLEVLGGRQVLSLIFLSGFSTSPILTEISGRGLGLAIVREKVERLGGTIDVETRRDAGATFRIALPVTLATFRGVLIREGEKHFIVPAASVDRVVRVALSDARTVENRLTISLDGRAVSLVSLGDVLGLPDRSAEAGDTMQVVLLGRGDAQIAFRVDEVVAEQEVLVKGLGPQLARVRNVSGAALLGTGEVVPVLNVPDLLASAVKPGMQRPRPSAEAPPDTGKKRPILVVEDSITSRMLLKNILEAAGYDVTTTVDGVDAWTTLRTGSFDLVVSDVEMPRMDGFDLTARIRADPQRSGIPVVLVTALASREHRERGIDVGANAYIVKSSFDQSNLLEVIERLI